MANYATLDFFPDLTPAEISLSSRLTFSSYTPNSSNIVWDVKAAYTPAPSAILLTYYFQVELQAGATYDFFATSRFDPGDFAIYDSSGNAVALNSEADDPAAIDINGVSFQTDVIWNFQAPYTGTYYIHPDWVRSNLYGYVSLEVYGDLGTATPATVQVMAGGEGADSLSGDGGSDTILGLDGDDTISGSGGADDLNGNKGADLVSGGFGADTVRGGQGNDTVYGDEGDDLHVNGNLGDDVVFGGGGNDLLFGGPGADTLWGGSGADVLAGDLGDGDVLYGELGGDRFAIRAGAGFDWAADFRPAEGDRILLAPGSTYTVTTYDNQVVISLGSGDQLGLVGIAAGSFQASWIVFS